MQPAEEPVTLVGAGLVGSCLATLLGRRGYDVRVLERRPDMRRQELSAGRSINLAVSVRGLTALKLLGLEERVLRLAVPMRGRMMHAADGTLTFQRYGKDDSECINSVSRGELNRLLLDAAEETGRVRLRFGCKVASANLEAGGAGELRLQDERGGDLGVERAARIIGTDGSASVVRDAVVARAGARCRSEELDYGYKELTLPAGPGGRHLFERNALHIWPRGTYMLIALPNRDGSFTCTLFLPHRGPLSFEELSQPEQVRELFTEQFPDVYRLIPELERAFFANPTGRMVTVKCEAWHDRDRALLLGDAAHAIVPFFGQGMNCGFEDCTVLEGLLDGGARIGGDTFARMQELRRANADAIADMAVENFVEMRDKVASPAFLLEKGVERILQEKFPGEYVSRYGLVTFSCEPYRFAYEMGRIQSALLAELCGGISAPEQVDLEKAGRLIREKLAPHFKKERKNGS